MSIKAELLKVRERCLDAWGAFVAGLPAQSATVLPFMKAGVEPQIRLPG